MGLLFVGFSLALVGVEPPRILLYIVVGVTCVLLPCIFIDTLFARIIVAASGAATVIVSLIAGAGIIAWKAIRWRDIDARLMLPSVFLLT
jgi:hypothetical protein